MSGSIENIIAHPEGIDPLSQYLKWQQLHQGQAQTALTQQQTAGAGIQNQLGQLNLQRQGYLYGLAGVPGVGGNAGGAPGAAGGAPAPAPAAGNPGVGPEMPNAAPSAGTAPGGAAGGAYPGQMGMDHLGVPLPPLQAMAVLTSQDPNAALKTSLEARRQAIFSAVAGSAPQDYTTVMGALYRAGWITPQMMQDAVNHPEGRARIMQATQTPEAYQGMVNAQLGMGVQPNTATGLPEVSPVGVGAKGAVAGATAAGQGQFETVQITIPDPDNPGHYKTITTTKTNAPNILAQGGGARQESLADKYNPAVTIDPATYVQRQNGQENAGGTATTRNPLSSATGNGQFTDGTWTQTVAAAKPAWAQGMTPAQVLAARTDPLHPEYMAQMQWAYAQQNGQKLTADSLPVNTWTLGMAHQFGPDGAAKIMQAPPGTPMNKVVSADVLKANPQFAKMTTDQVSNIALSNYGLNSIDLSKPYAAAVPQPSAPPGAVAGPPVLTPTQTAGLANTSKTIEGDRKLVDDAVGIAQNGQAANTLLLQTRDLVPQINAGNAAEFRQGVQNWAATWSPEFAQKMVAALSGGNIDPSKAGATQEIVKLMLQNAGAQEKATLGSNGGYEAIRLYQIANPNISMQPTAIHDMLNLLAVAHQRSIDYGTGANDFFQQQQQGFNSGSGKYTSIASYNKQFLAENPPQVYVGATAALNGHPYADWSKGLTGPQQTRALQILWRTDPTAVVIGPDGKKWGAPPAPAAP